MKIQSINNSQQNRSFKARIYNETQLFLNEDFLRRLADMAASIGDPYDGIYFSINKSGTVQLAAHKDGLTKPCFVADGKITCPLTPNNFGLRALELLERNKDIIGFALNNK